MGAAIQAGIIAGNKTRSILIDVTPYTFGTSALAEIEGEVYPYCFIPLIRKNTPIPVSKSEAFSAVFDGQAKVEVNVYQDEDRDALNNIEIGRFFVEGLRNAPAGNVIVTTFSLDLDGILHVTSREKETGLEHSITINNAMVPFDNDKLEEARSRVQALFGEESPFPLQIDGDSETRRHGVEALALVEKAERMMAKANTQDSEDLVNGIETVRDTMDQGGASLKAAMNKLADLLYYLEA